MNSTDEVPHSEDWEEHYATATAYGGTIRSRGVG